MMVLVALCLLLALVPVGILVGRLLGRRGR